MAKIQPCRNGCGQLITVQEHENKWKPFNVSESGTIMGLHDCPNSQWNKQQQQQQNTITTTTANQARAEWTGTNKQGQIFEARVSKGLQESEINYNELILKLLTQINQQQKEQNTTLNTWNNSLQEMYNMISAIFQHFGLNEPQPLKSQTDDVKELDTIEDMAAAQKQYEYEKEKERDAAAAKEEREKNGSEYSF